MKILTDFFPIVLFYIAYKLEGIYVATAVAIAACVVQVAYLRFTHKKIEMVHWVTLGLVVVFGGATLLLQDETFIKWKPSIINWLFGAAFLGSQFIGAKPLIQRMMGQNMRLATPIWYRLNLIWSLFFFAVGCINLYVVHNFDTDTWADFKLFGMLGLTLVFLVGQGFYLMRHVEPANQPENED